MAQSVGCYTSQVHLPRGGTAHNELCPPTTSINQEHTPQARVQANLMGGTFTILFPSS